MFISTAAYADDDDWRGNRSYEYGGYPQYHEEIIYSPPVVEYVPQPIVEYVPVQPYYPPAPPVRYYNYYQPTPQGFIGSVIGGGMGYELGGGNPLAAGIGAAAGAWLGNGGY